ncbi:MAG: hypothetical protein HY951_01770 [Bacteroidia bacterium]|nr:hypothetical protein [Bacteroidia bacterium]
MKRFLLIVLFFLIIKISYGQEIHINSYPNSIIDIGIGVGPNYGIMGFKTVLGYKGTGVMVGAGTISGMFAYEIGLQASAKWLFINIGYGVYGKSTYVTYYYSYEDVISGLIINAGGKINLVKSKKLFLELGIGYGTGGKIESPYGPPRTIDGPSAVLGIGYKIAL